MRFRAESGLAVLMAVAAWLPACSQSRLVNRLAPSGTPFATASSCAAAGSSDTAVREIDDPHTGDRWMLMRDPAHPGGPGRLVLAGGPGIEQSSAATRNEKQPAASDANQMLRCFVIHAGDALILEDHTATVDARLEAVALGPASQGAVFRARLRIGGKVVRAIAISARRAVFAPVDEVWP